MEKIKFYYKGLGGCQSVCQLSIDKTRDLVIATELAENQGSSITDFAEELATLVVQVYGLNPFRLIWIENYNKMSYPDGKDTNESFALVTFMIYAGKFKAPQWQSISKNEVDVFLT